MSVLVINRNKEIVHDLNNLEDGDLEFLFETAFMGPGQIQILGTGFDTVTVTIYGAAFFQQYNACPIETIPFSGHDLHPGTGILTGSTGTTSISKFLPADFATGSLGMKVSGTDGIITEIRVTGRN